MSLAIWDATNQKEIPISGLVNINDSVVSEDSTWSSEKINASLGSGGSGSWVGTQAKFDAYDKSQLKDGQEVIITDDYKASELATVEYVDNNLGELIKTKIISLPYSNLENGKSKHYNLYNYGIEMEGYTPIGIIGFRAENMGVVPAHMSVSNNTYGVIIRNISGATASEKCSITVLYVKNL